jgi:competence protein ComEC
LPQGRAEIAVALLLGRYELLEEDVTERYMRTGTMHILAISGQHLAILAGFLWLVLRFVPIPRKWGAIVLGVVVVSYALLTGARPPVLRAAVLVCALIGAIVLDVRLRKANPLALALVIVLAVNPSDLFDRGLQLSFLAVGALSWIVQPVWLWLRREPDPIEQLLAETRPRWMQWTFAAGRVVVFAFVMSGVVWLANVPLLASRFHLFSPIVVPLTVVMTPFATVALIAGLALLVVDPWIPWLGGFLAKVSDWGIRGMDWCVEFGAGLPGGYWYVPGPPDWWVIGFYLGVLGVLLFRPEGVIRWRWAVAGVAWLALGFAVPALRPGSDQLECQILSVGNGSAAVLRVPGGKTVLVDAGHIAGPRVGARQIAPALWSAGIRRIDAVFISHADVDHFNGLPHLAERFSIGEVFVPPHFANANHEGVKLACDALRRHDVPIRVCFAGDQFDFGGFVKSQVLHPPADFGGTDNEQSLVLMVEFCGRRILLPGDLEGAGLRRLMGGTPQPVDVLVAPHHGSRRANPPELVEWTRPKLVVVSQGRPRSGATLESYRAADIPILTTNEHGAISVRVDRSGIDVSTTRRTILSSQLNNNRRLAH